MNRLRFWWYKTFNKKGYMAKKGYYKFNLIAGKPAKGGIFILCVQTNKKEMASLDRAYKVISVGKNGRVVLKEKQL